jgi:hypothetical protein
MFVFSFRLCSLSLATDDASRPQWRYLTLALTFCTEFMLILRPAPSPLFDFLLPNRLPYEHIAFLRQFFISSSMAMSQLAPLLFPPPPQLQGTPEEQAAARAMADAEALRPLLQRLAALTAQADAEAMAMQQHELRPLFVVGAPAEGTESKGQRETREREIVADLKEKMVATFQDLQLKGAPATAEIWTRAVNAGRARELKRAADGGTDGSRIPLLEASLPTSSIRSTSPSPSSILVPPASTLASPPSSPMLGFPSKSLYPPFIEQPPATSPPSPSPTVAQPVKPPPDSDAASRLPSPPPEEEGASLK